MKQEIPENAVLKKVCIVIPIHKAIPDDNELVSLKCCFRVLGKYDIFIVCPEQLDLNVYQKTLDGFAVKIVNPEWLCVALLLHFVWLASI